MGDRIIVRKDGHLAWLIFNRPERLNAMTIETWSMMDDRLRELDQDRNIRCLVLAGEGRSFLAGHDVSELREHNEDLESGKLTASQLREWQENLQESTRLIRGVRFPVLAAVQGYAVGAGCEVALACDLVVASEGAQFGFPEVNIGVTITNGGTYFLSRKVELARAREMAYTGELVSAEEAYRIGIVNRVVAAGEEREQAERLARRIASRAPVAVHLHKAMLDSACESSLEAALNFETESLVRPRLLVTTWRVPRPSSRSASHASPGSERGASRAAPMGRRSTRRLLRRCKIRPECCQLRATHSRRPVPRRSGRVDVSDPRFSSRRGSTSLRFAARRR